VIFSSPLRRALQTATLVATHLGLAVEPAVEHLREVDVGDLDGRSDEAAWATYEAVLSAWRVGNLSARFPGGEDGTGLVARLRHGLAAVSSLAGHRLPLVIAHGGNLRAALPSLTGSGDPGRDLALAGIASLESQESHRSPYQWRLLHWETGESAAGDS
jgi:probable phosphoglycerate mutase